MRLEQTVGFLGAGNMTTALIGGMLSAGVAEPQQLHVANRSNRERLLRLADQFGVRAAESKADLVRKCDLLVLACKPKDVPGLLAELTGHVRPTHVLLTLAAGVTMASLQEHLPAGVQMLRAMPNTSCLVRESATALAAAPGAGADAIRSCRLILEAVGKVVEVPEELLDAVTGLSGSGPAYVYLMVEALIEAGTRVGLSRAVAHDLVLQTLTGAAKMLRETGTDPGVLREQVTSPGGTTMAGLQVLAERGFDQAVVQAVARATQRAREMGAALSAHSVAGD